MRTIGTPLQIPELRLSPEYEGGAKLSDDMQQVLSLLTAFWKNQRVVLKASPTGVLSVSSARIKDIEHFTSTGVNDAQTGTDIPCTEILCMAHPDNTSRVWVRTDQTATTGNSWPLDAGQSVGFTVHNMRQLNMLFAGATDKLIVAYTE